MSFIQAPLKWLMKYRMAEVERLQKDPVPAQEKTFFELLSRAENTEWGQKYGYDSIKSISEFQKTVPINSYEDLFPYIERMMASEGNVLWPGIIGWFSKSSGTTNARSKFIPVSNESLEECHFEAGKDELGLYIKNNPNTKIFDGKSLCVGGSLYQINEDPEIFCGDVSAVIMNNLPMWAQYLRTPSLETALMPEFEAKLERLASEASKENVTSIAGVPTWVSVVVRKVLEQTGAKNIYEVWPNLEVFFHGAVAFAPYKKLFAELFPSPNMKYMEAYNASEGFFAIQDDPSREGEMMLMPDYGVFYEFIPMSEFGTKDQKAITMADVEIGKNYALIISTNGGLWRYVIGDTVAFTTLFPHRIKITGRTKHFMNAFGEEVVVHNADMAIKEACEATGASVEDYTACPIYMGGQGSKGGHEWIVEFNAEPDSLDNFRVTLDASLRRINSDYDAKRHKDIALVEPVVHKAPKGTFYNWMKSRGKLGGQNKVPRLSNDRTHVEEILKLI